MALGGVFMSDIDGNIGVEKTNVTERISGLLFDISGQTDFWTKPCCKSSKHTEGLRSRAE